MRKGIFRLRAPKKEREDKGLFTPYGSFVQHISRREKVAWIGFLLLLAVVLIQGLTARFTPHNVIVVDANGRLLGEWTGSERTEQEVLIDVTRFIQHYTSANSATIAQDVNLWINALTPEAKSLHYDILIEQDLLAELFRIGSVSNTRVETMDILLHGSSDVLAREKRAWAVRVRGSVIIHAARRSEVDDFDYYMTFTLVPYTRYTDLGLADVEIYPYDAHREVGAADGAVQ